MGSAEIQECVLRNVRSLVNRSLRGLYVDNVAVRYMQPISFVKLGFAYRMKTHMCVLS